MRRGLHTLLAVVLGATLAGPAVTPARPAQAATVARAAASSADNWSDDDADWYRQSVVDIAAYAAEPEVRDAATAALAAGTVAAIADFVDTGWAQARNAAAARRTADRNQVKTWSQTGGPYVKAAATKALAGGDYTIGEFVAYGHEIADRLDHPADNTPAEQERIYRRVEQMIAIGGPTVVADGSAALASADPAVIADFYTSGYATADKADWDNRERVRQAIEQRNESIDLLTGNADAAATAATARAEIVRANIQGLQYLEDALLAMRLSAAAAQDAGQIFDQDRAARPSGAKGRTALLEARKADAIAQAGRASQTASQMNAVIAQVQVAAKDLTDSGQSYGSDWAQVTVAVGLSAQAAAHAAATASAAATATLADSLALDADQGATVHAGNAARWLAETQYQEKKASDLALVAKAQQKIAENAAKRAKDQRTLAEQAATAARQHADKAKTLRADAQRASDNAVAQAQVAGSAQLAANDAVRRESAAADRVNQATGTLKAATSICYTAEAEYTAVTQALQRARDEATAAGQDADAATRDLQAQADRARNAYNSAQAWANQSQAAADAAKSEAAKASAAAQQARDAARKAQLDSLTARRASDKAGQAAVDAVHAAESARVGAENTQAEAEAAVREAGQAVIQADIAGDAAGSAAALAELTVDRAGTASYIAARVAAINADARDAMAVADEATLISRQQADAAAQRAAEAQAAADHATGEATAAVGDIKPAYESAARAIGSANVAVGAAGKAYTAAVAATNDANGASTAAATAGRWESAAWRDANVAGIAAQNASAAAAAAGRASASIDRAYAWAKTTTADIHTQATKLAGILQGLVDEKAKQDAIAREQQEFEAKVKDGILSYLQCEVAMVDACKHLWDLVQPSLQTALDASKNHIALLAKCYTGDKAACDQAQANGDKVREFFVQVGAGLWEGAKGFVQGLKAVVDCASWVVVGFNGDYFQNNCGKVVDGLNQMPDMLKNHPLELIHITEWHDNPGKAFGLTLFDIGSFAIPGVGELAGTLSKTLSGLNKLLRLGLTKMSGGIGRIERFAIRMAEVPGAVTGRVAQITGVALRIENGVAKFDDAVALIDDTLYKVDATTARIDGALDTLDGAVVHLEGGTLTIENGVAKIKNLVLKIDKDVDLPDDPPTCGLLRAAKVAVAAVGLGCNGTQADGSWQYTENGVLLQLDRKTNAAIDAALRAATDAEASLSPRMVDLINSFPGASREGWAYRLKTADSLKRKVYGDLKDQPGLTVAEELGGIGDNVRYTALLPFDQYVSGVENAVRAMKAQRYELVKVKNGWSAGSKGNYKGLNLTWRDPRTGSLFELQFHTADSFWVNKAEHPFYEISRLPDLEPGDMTEWGLTIEQAQAISDGMWSTVGVPTGAGDLSFPLGT